LVGRAVACAPKSGRQRSAIPTISANLRNLWIRNESENYERRIDGEPAAFRNPVSAIRNSLYSHSRTPRLGSRGLMMPPSLSHTAFTAGRTVSHGNAEPGLACS
jgi:hypothetical protein